MLDYTPQVMDQLGKIRVADFHKTAANERLARKAKKSETEEKARGRGIIDAVLSLLP